ncbi:MAG: hypothetical protein U1E37_02375 [Sphingomonadaceae bacterium]
MQHEIGEQVERGLEVGVSALSVTAELSTPAPAPIEAPSRSCSSAIWVALRFSVPSSSSDIISDWVPGPSWASAA